VIDPPRLLDQDDDDALKRVILRSSELDAPSAQSLRRAHALALGIASSAIATVGAASAAKAASAGVGAAGAAGAATVGSVSTVKMIAIWVGVGLFSGALVSGTAVTVLDAGARPEITPPQATTAEAPRARPAAQPDRRASSVRAAEANQPSTEIGTSAVAAFEDTSAPTADRSVASKRAAAPAAEPTPAAPTKTTTLAQGSARYDSAASDPQAPKPAGALSDELAQELASVDQARSALRSGNAPAALELVSRYERSYKRPRFAPEASALRIEALIALGRRAEAARLARVFMANHPGHPLTVRLRGFLGETP
jgi:hypothetical protein